QGAVGGAVAVVKAAVGVTVVARRVGVGALVPAFLASVARVAVALVDGDDLGDVTTLVVVAVVGRTIVVVAVVVARVAARIAAIVVLRHSEGARANGGGQGNGNGGRSGTFHKIELLHRGYG